MNFISVPGNVKRPAFIPVNVFLGFTVSQNYVTRSYTTRQIRYKLHTVHGTLF